MKSALIIFAILTAANPAKVDKTCRDCKGTTIRRCVMHPFRDAPWFELPGFAWCATCDGYGKEKTIYGRLLNGAK